VNSLEHNLEPNKGGRPSPLLTRLASCIDRGLMSYGVLDALKAYVQDCKRGSHPEPNDETTGGA